MHSETAFWKALAASSDVQADLAAAEERRWRDETAAKIVAKGRLHLEEERGERKWWRVYNLPSREYPYGRLAGKIYHGPQDVVHGGPVIIQWSYAITESGSGSSWGLGGMLHIGGTASNMDEALRLIDQAREI